MITIGIIFIVLPVLLLLMIAYEAKHDASGGATLEAAIIIALVRQYLFIIGFVLLVIGIFARILG